MKTARMFLTMLRDGNARDLTLGMVDDMLREYPYFTLPAVMLLQSDNSRHFLSPSDRRRIMATLALNAADPATLMALVEPGDEQLAAFYPPEEPTTPTTNAAIDTFLETFGHADEKETALLERLIFNPTPDYGSVLEAEAQKDREAPVETPEPTGDATLDSINSFIASHPAPAPRRQEAEEPRKEPAVEEPVAQETLMPESAPRQSVEKKKAKTESSSLSESLAKIYIRQRKYQKAYDILLKLSETHPDASPYTADRLRFLRKAILASGI